jgi:hypothetical protein
MSFIGRLERNIEKLEKHIDKEHNKTEELFKKYCDKKINHAEFNLKNKKIEEKIRALDSRKRVLQGAIAKEKRRLEEKAEKKGERKKREQAYFDWSEKKLSK